MRKTHPGFIALTVLLGPQQSFAGIRWFPTISLKDRRKVPTHFNWRSTFTRRAPASQDLSVLSNATST